MRRDEIDGKLADLDGQAVSDAPSSADPYAESLARFLSVFGFQVSDEGKALPFVLEGLGQGDRARAHGGLWAYGLDAPIRAFGRAYDAGSGSGIA